MNSILRNLLLCLALVSGRNAVAADSPLDLSGDYQVLQGRWAVLRNEIKKRTTPEMHGHLFIFEGRTFRIDPDQGTEDFSIDESNVPKHIDFADGRSPAIKGIYILDGDSLVICIGAPGANRPREFKTSVLEWNGPTVLRRQL